MSQSLVSFHTLGCKLNFSETATIARQFKGEGFQVVDFDQPADVCVINTCSVTEEADKKCRKAIKQAHKLNPNAYVIVVGCYAQLKPEAIAAIPGVNAVLGAAEKFRIFELLEDFNPEFQSTVHRCEINATQDFVASFSVEDRTRAFLKVQDGCDYKCSFCTIPLARGQSRSDSPKNIIQNAQSLVDANVQEIVLTGVNIGDYGFEDTDFFGLIQQLDSSVPIPRIRISSIEPNLLSDAIIDFVAQSERFMPHFHVPLQSGSDTILALMRRRYKRQLYADRVFRIKETMPQACIGCDVIVGFPGETDQEFEETYTFLAELPVSYLHVFSFSERANTLAPTYQNPVAPEVKKERSERLRSLSLRKKLDFYRTFIGQTVEVLFESEEESGYWGGWSANYLRVQCESETPLANQIHRVQLSALDPNGFLLAIALRHSTVKSIA
jgi:threonylcarbamoyladenosine tRNA methylthiotransferase MtaB